MRKVLGAAVVFVTATVSWKICPGRSVYTNALRDPPRSPPPGSTDQPPVLSVGAASVGAGVCAPAGEPTRSAPATSSREANPIRRLRCVLVIDPPSWMDAGAGVSRPGIRGFGLA